MASDDPDRWRRVCAYFEAARSLHGDAREALLASAPDVADDVRDLLTHHDADDPAFDGAAGLTVDGVLDGPAVGDRIGDYTLEALLGEGGMAHVFRATGPDGVVALKVLKPEFQGEAEVLRRFRREAEVGARLRDGGIVRTRGLVGEACLVLEYVAGETLADRLARDGAFDEAQATSWAAALLPTLHSIHEAGLVHRDLKPSNIMAADDGRVVVMDLGIALPFDELLRLSRTGQFVGTVRYAAPEQLSAEKARVDARTDLYALGLVLYEMVAGTHPMPAGGFVSTMRAHLSFAPPPLAEVVPSVSARFSDTVRELLAKQPEDRPASATEVMTRLGL